MFSNINQRHPGVSDGLASGYSEAARVCLDRHHVSPATFLVSDNELNEQAEAAWEKASSRITGAWANKDDATEAAAYGLSLAAIEMTRGLVAVSRAETRTGADYYRGYPDGEADDLKYAFRLEVSGTDEGNDALMRSRLREKQTQARRGISNVPAIASVVGFAASRIMSVDVEGT